MENEKKDDLAQLNGRIPIKLRDDFWATKRKGMTGQHVLSAAARLWIQLPAELRKELTDAESDIEKEPQKAKDSFVEAVRSIAKDEIQRSNKTKK
ncbi:MAG TPA: hypothetical protein DDW84_05835 [Phycisphaerales bacterium]|nr:MAG: hypothetical protein A2Y13_10690 [Planctomycetes bacterium GWC2_45_44]HBG78353.1 hypothetical protein [Phycisphaerales bacterium]HBR19925.1 hypothetical protein [Phycisphaerales bacterium]